MVDGCESELVLFFVVIYGDFLLLVDFVIIVCDGELVIIEFNFGNDNFFFDFYFYGNFSLSNLLYVGLEYIFMLIMSIIIYIMEFNEICEMVFELVDIILEILLIVIFGELSCYVGNILYSIIIIIDVVNIVIFDGFVINNNDGIFIIEDIFFGVLVMIMFENSMVDCNSDVEFFEFDCGCFLLVFFVSGGDQMICVGEFLFMLSVSVGLGEIIDWYDVFIGGILFVIGVIYMLVIVGIYYVEVCILVDDCVSSI